MQKTRGRGSQLLALVCLAASRKAWADAALEPPPVATPTAAVSPSAPPAGSSGSDSLVSRGLPFLPAPSPGQPFAASELTRRYARDLAPILSPPPRLSIRDRREIERLARYARVDTAAVDSSNIRLVHGATLPALSPEEKEKQAHREPGAHVAIPSPVAATAALLGGLALLVKLIAELAR